MKFTFKNIGKYLSVILMSGGLLACSEDIMDDINKNVDNAHDVDAKFILTDVITSTAFSNVGGDFNHYFSSYIEHEVGVYNQLWNAETRIQEVYSSTTFNNVWGNLYSTLKNARIIIDKCSDTGTQPGNYTTKGMAEVLAAINSALITDAFGDAPFSEAALAKLDNGKPQFMTPKIDAQKDIYTGIINYLDAAIEDLPKGDTHATGGPGSQDILFGGDDKAVDKWLKLAYGLKARYLMHTLNKAENQTEVLNEVLECIEKSAQNADEQAAFAIYNGSSNINPCYDFFDSREYLAASQSLFDKLNERNDPRISRVYVTALDDDSKGKQISGKDDENLMLAPNGKPEQTQRKYSTSIFGLASDAPTLLLSYHELLFIKAEALIRLNKTNDAKTALKDAIKAAFANMEKNVASALKQSSYPITKNSVAALTDNDAETYFTSSVEPKFDADPLKETMIQKYLGMWGSNGETTECYNDVRRLQAEGKSLKDFYGFKNEGKFPLRAPYGGDEVSSNPNVQKAYGNGQYVFTEAVWWAGGNR